MCFLRASAGATKKHTIMQHEQPLLAYCHGVRLFGRLRPVLVQVGVLADRYGGRQRAYEGVAGGVIPGGGPAKDAEANHLRRQRSCRGGGNHHRRQRRRDHGVKGRSGEQESVGFALNHT